MSLLHPEECRLFFAVLRGEHYLNALRNRDVAAQLYPTPAKNLAD
ncbi:MAG TPA: hypothetical protein VGY58_20620 [Gemmataceae bacterium]|nr:hypothetical protein [Gemmataceae bacterium]